MVVVGKPAPIQHFIVYIKAGMRLSTHPHTPPGAAAAAFLQAAPSGWQAPFFPSFPFYLASNCKTPVLRMSSLSCQCVGVTAAWGEPSLQIPALGPALWWC